MQSHILKTVQDGPVQFIKCFFIIDKNRMQNLACVKAFTALTTCMLSLPIFKYVIKKNININLLYTLWNAGTGGKSWVGGEVQSYYQATLGWPSKCCHSFSRRIPRVPKKCSCKLQVLVIYSFIVSTVGNVYVPFIFSGVKVYALNNNVVDLNPQCLELLQI